MLAVVKMHHTSFEIKGDIPNDLLNYIKKYYQEGLEITDDEEYINAFESDWYKEQEKNWHPGKSVYVYRDNKGWTQAELGKKLGGLSRQYISDLERGKRSISKKVAIQLSQLFNRKIERFLEIKRIKNLQKNSP